MNLLFICTHNRCRSILAQAIARQLLSAKFKVQSAGSAPAGEVHPQTLENLKRHGYNTDDLTSQSWDDLADFTPKVAITVCDNAANEACPMWLGDAVKIHWGLTDPTADTIAENDRQNVFDQVIATLEKRMKQLASFNLDSLSKNQLKTVFNKIGEIK